MKSYEYRHIPNCFSFQKKLHK